MNAWVRDELKQTAQRLLITDKDAMLPTPASLILEVLSDLEQAYQRPSRLEMEEIEMDLEFAKTEAADLTHSIQELEREVAFLQDELARMEEERYQ